MTPDERQLLERDFKDRAERGLGLLRLQAPGLLNFEDGGVCADIAGNLIADVAALLFLRGLLTDDVEAALQEGCSIAWNEFATLYPPVAERKPTAPQGE